MCCFLSPPASQGTMFNSSFLFPYSLSPSNPEGHLSLWVGNITQSVTEKQLIELFSRWVRIQVTCIWSKSCNWSMFVKQKWTNLDVLLLQIWCRIKCASVAWEVLCIHQLQGQVCARYCYEAPSGQRSGGRALTHPLPEQSSPWADYAEKDSACKVNASDTVLWTS